MEASLTKVSTVGSIFLRVSPGALGLGVVQPDRHKNKLRNSTADSFIAFSSSMEAAQAA